MPAVIAAAAATAVLWLAFAGASARPLAIVACACALGLATPTAVIVAVGGAARLACSCATLPVTRQVLVAESIDSLLAIPLAAGALYPLTGWLADPVLAAAAMAASSLTVVANSLRLRRLPLG